MIKVSRLADYAVILLGEFYKDPSHFRSANDLAEHTPLSYPTVSKLLKLLQHAGILESSMGMMGGYRVTKSATELHLMDVVCAVDGPVTLTDCLSDGGKSCDHASWCQLHSGWDYINGIITDALKQVTIADMLEHMRNPVVNTTAVLVQKEGGRYDQ